MTIEEMLRSGRVQTADNGLMYATIPEAANGGDESGGHGNDSTARALAHLVVAVPRALVPRLGRSVCYFVPWLVKQRKTVAIALQAAAEDENRKELCHHLDVKPSGNLLLISLRFYEHDSYGLAMEFFDKVAYLAALEPAAESAKEFDELLHRQLEGKPGELTPEAWEWRSGFLEATPAAADEAWLNYRRAAETDALGLYMAALQTDVFYEDLFEPEAEFPALDPEMVCERVRVMERLYPPNRGFSLQVVRPRRRRRAAGQKSLSS